MISLQGTVRKTVLSFQTPLCPVTSGCKNSVFLHLKFSPHWQEYPCRYAEFFTQNGECFHAPVRERGRCAVPEEALLRSGPVLVSVIGEAKRPDGEVMTRVATARTAFHVTAGNCEGGVEHGQ